MTIIVKYYKLYTRIGLKREEGYELKLEERHLREVSKKIVAGLEDEDLLFKAEYSLCHLKLCGISDDQIVQQLIDNNVTFQEALRRSEERRVGKEC